MNKWYSLESQFSQKRCCNEYEMHQTKNVVLEIYLKKVRYGNKEQLLKKITRKHELALNIEGRFVEIKIMGS